MYHVSPSGKITCDTAEEVLALRDAVILHNAVKLDLPSDGVEVPHSQNDDRLEIALETPD